MTSILLVCHAELGAALAASARVIVGDDTALEVFDVTPSDDPQAAENMLRQRLAATGQGTLVLTDVPGATPHNIAVRAVRGMDIPVVSGASLPMLIRALNHCRLDSDSLARYAEAGGHRAIVREPPA